MTNEQLAIRIKAGIDVAENMLLLWEQTERFIGMIAVKYQAYEDVEDLKQQGYIGLCNAVDHYDIEKDCSFLHYASFWIRQSMKRYIEECGKVVKMPAAVRNDIGKYKKFNTDYLQYFGSVPDDQETCYYLGINQEKLDNIKHAAVMDNMGSLDIPLGEGEDSSMYELLPGGADPAEKVLERLQQEEMREELWGMVRELPEVQAEILRLRYQQEKTIKETSEQVSRTASQTRNLEFKALRSLREPERAARLRMLIDGNIYSEGMKRNSVESFRRTWTSSTEYAALKFLGE